MNKKAESYAVTVWIDPARPELHEACLSEYFVTPQLKDNAIGAMRMIIAEEVITVLTPVDVYSEPYDSFAMEGRPDPRSTPLAIPSALTPTDSSND